MKKLLISISILIGALLPLGIAHATAPGQANLKCSPPVGTYWTKYCAIFKYPTGSYWVYYCSKYPDYCATL